MVTRVCLSPQEILGTLDLHVNILCASQLSKKTAFCLPGGMDYECLHNHQEMHQSLEMGKLHLTLASLKLLARAAVTKGGKVVSGRQGIRPRKIPPHGQTQTF